MARSCGRTEFPASEATPSHLGLITSLSLSKGDAASRPDRENRGLA